jgi:imidazolonepropionase-like amidohydrolase
MRKFLLTFALTLVFLVSIAPPATAAPGAIRCGQLLDVRTGRLLKDQVIVFDAEGVITAVGPTGSPMSAGGATTVDLPSATCLPGLIDVHTHLTGDPASSGYQGLGISVPREAITGVKNARLTVRAGFTTVRNVGASNYTDVALRDGINAGEVEGPRMFVSGPPLGITGGHCDNNLLPFEFHFRIAA